MRLHKRPAWKNYFAAAKKISIGVLPGKLLGTLNHTGASTSNKECTPPAPYSGMAYQGDSETGLGNGWKRMECTQTMP